MSQEKFSKEVQLMLYCARVSMDTSIQGKLQELLRLPLNWNYIIEQSRYHEILPLLYFNIQKIRKQHFSKSIFAILKNSYYATLIKNMYLWREFCHIQDEFNKAGIKVIPLKGIILAETLYHNLGLRPMVDIDILVKEGDLSLAEKQLQLLGYQKHLENLPESYWLKYRHHFPFYSPHKNINLEVHWALAPPHPNKLNLKETWERSHIQIISQKEILTLSAEDILLSLCLHICRKITSLQYLKLKNLCDINELILQSQNLDWDYVINKAIAWRIKGALFYVYLLTEKYFSTPWLLKIPDVFKLKALSNKILNLFVERQFLLERKSHIRPKSQLYASLLMLLMADTIKDYFTLGLQKLSIIFSKSFIGKTGDDSNVLERQKQQVLKSSLKYHQEAFYNSKYSLSIKERLFTDGYSLLPKKLSVKLIGKDKKVLEIGSGKGNLSYALAKNNNAVIGIDISKVAVKIANYNKDTKLNLDFKQKGAVKLDFQKELFDYVISIDLIEHFPKEDLNTHLKEVYRVLKKGGRYIFWTPSRLYGYSRETHFHEYTLGELIPILKENNFEKIIAYYPYLIFFNIACKLPTSLMPLLVSYENILESIEKYFFSKKVKYLKPFIPPIFLSALKR